MANLNKVLLIGNLCRDPELKYTNNDMAICSFSIATNRVYMSNDEKQEEVTFVEITVFGKQAEPCGKYLFKGSPAFIEGRLKLDTWKDKESGANRSKLAVIAERVQFLSTKQDGQESQPQQQSQPPQQRSGGFQPDGMAQDYDQAPHPGANADYQDAKDNATFSSDDDDIKF